MNPSLLEELGLKVSSAPGTRLEAELPLKNALINPLTRKPINQVRFTVVDDRLLVIAPPALVGTAPVGLGRVEKASDLEDALIASFNDHIFHVQRRSAELTALGLFPKVDPESLQLSAEFDAQPFRFVIGTDKRGNFRVQRASRGTHELAVDAAVQPFELSEFREQGALAGYLQALFAEPHDGPQTPPRQALVSFGEVVKRFGTSAVLPPKSSLEVLIELSVDSAHYRFAAARVSGNSFRGLLAGSSGKIWAERFELDQFPGVEPLVARLLKVPTARVKVIPPAEVS
ncbi:MAG: hypothetical protein ACT4TC_14905 [Myxococcaceae bacterium]